MLTKTFSMRALGRIGELAIGLLATISLAYATMPAGGNYALPASTLNNGVGTMTGSSVYRLTSSLGESFGSATTSGTGYALQAGFTKAATALESTITLGSNINPSVVNQAVTLTATVTGTNPTGNVTFKSDGTNLAGCAAVALSGGNALCVTSALAQGSHNLTAVYNGDAFNASATSVTLVQTVSAMGATVSITTLSANPVNSSRSGQTVTLAALVTGSAGAPTGYVELKDGATSLGSFALSGQTANFMTNALGVGNHVLGAYYSGNASYQSSQGTLNYSVVAPINTTLAFTTAPNPSQPGQSFTVTASVSDSPTGGTVSVSGGGQSCTINLPATTCTLSFATRGVKRLSATFSGYGSYEGSAASVTHYVGNKPDLTPILMLLLD